MTEINQSYLGDKKEIQKQYNQYVHVYVSPEARRARQQSKLEKELLKIQIPLGRDPMHFPNTEKECAQKENLLIMLNAGE